MVLVGDPFVLFGGHYTERQTAWQLRCNTDKLESGPAGCCGLGSVLEAQTELRSSHTHSKAPGRANELARRTPTCYLYAMQLLGPHRIKACFREHSASNDGEVSVEAI